MLNNPDNVLIPFRAFIDSEAQENYHKCTDGT